MRIDLLPKLTPAFLLLLYAGSLVPLAADANPTASPTAISALPVPPTPGNVSASTSPGNLTEIHMAIAPIAPGTATPRPSPGTAFTFVPALLALCLIALRNRD